MSNIVGQRKSPRFRKVMALGGCVLACACTDDPPHPDGGEALGGAGGTVAEGGFGGGDGGDSGGSGGAGGETTDVIREGSIYAYDAPPRFDDVAHVRARFVTRTPYTSIIPVEEDCIYSLVGTLSLLQREDAGTVRVVTPRSSFGADLRWHTLRGSRS